MVMKTIIVLLLMVFTLLAPVTGKAVDDLYISVSLTKGESSRDSNSRRTTITLEGDKIVYEITYQGYGASKRERVHKEYRATAEEIKTLIKVIEEHNLLASDSLEQPAESGLRRYFEITTDLSLNGRKSRTEISAPSGALKIKSEKLYQNSSALVEELFRILNAHDKEIQYGDDLLFDPQ